MMNNNINTYLFNGQVIQYKHRIFVLKQGTLNGLINHTYELDKTIL